MNILFLPDHCISGVGWGGSKLNMSKMVSIGSSSVCGTSLESFKRRFCNLFWCLLCVYLCPSTMYTNSFFNYSTFPTGHVILIFFKVNFSSAQMWSFVAYFVPGVAYRRRILSFRQTSSRLVSGVLRLGVILYTNRNCCSALSVGVPEPFLSARFNMFTKRSAWPFDLGWYCGVVICFIWKISQNSLNSTDVNLLLLSLTTQSTTPNSANSSCRNPIVILIVGLLYLRTSGPLGSRNHPGYPKNQHVSSNKVVLFLAKVWK